MKRYIVWGTEKVTQSGMKGEAKYGRTVLHSFRDKLSKSMHCVETLTTQIES